MHKYLPENIRNDEALQDFLKAVNASYSSFDRDHMLAERAFKISEEEYIEVNEKLKEVNEKLSEELNVKKMSIQQMRETIADLVEGATMPESEDLLYAVNFLKEQVAGRKEAKEELLVTAKRLSFLLSNLQSGILLEDEHRRIVVTNPTFCNFFDIPVAPDLLIGMDCSNAAEQSKHLFENPDQFVARIDELLSNKILVTQEELQLKDGRFLERSYIPIFLNDTYKGHLWKYDDITARKQAELKLKASEELRQFALEGAGDAVWEYLPASNLLILTESHVKMLGISIDQLTCKPEDWYKMVHPDDINIIREIELGYQTGNKHSHQCEYRVLNKEGDYSWILDRGMVVSTGPDYKAVRVVGTHADITNRKLTEVALQLSEEKYRNIIANMNLGLLEVDNEGLLQYANNRFCEMSGYTSDELAGQKLANLITFGENNKLVNEKFALRKKGVSDAYEIAVKTKRGELKWWIVSGAPLYKENGELSGSIGIYLDFTDRKKLEYELNEARDHAEQSARTKENFLANMSHEIRTPMNAILGMCNQLGKTSLSNDQSDYLQVINNATDHLMVVINDILDMSKIQAGMLSMENIGFNFKGEIRKAVLSMRTKADEKQIYLQMEVDNAISPILVGDPHRLNQIILNLLSNAVKFTNQGGVTIVGKLIEDLPSRQLIEIKVIDTGIGMDETFVENLFDKFAQEDKTIARKYGGTGLGMAIAKQLVEMMNGTITVKSKKGTGSEFCISVTFPKGSTADVPEKITTIRNPKIMDGKHILLVEDYEMNRLVVKTILKAFNIRISEAENGEEAIKLLKVENFDLILMDVQMPVMSGLEAIKIIRQHLHLKIPVIALTANAINGERERCLDAGMSGYLSKPFNEVELINCITDGLTNAGHFHPDVKPEQSSSGIPDELYNLNIIRDLGDGDVTFIKRMIDLFIQNVPNSVAAIKSAQFNKDVDTIRGQAHKLKTAIHNLNIITLKPVLQFLEILPPEEVDNQEVTKNIRLLEDVIARVITDLEHERDTKY